MSPSVLYGIKIIFKKFPIFFLLLVSQAVQASEIGTLGVVNFSLPSFQSGQRSQAGPAPQGIAARLGCGMSFGYELNTRMLIEGSVVYVSQGLASGADVLSYALLQLPLLYRYRLSLGPSRVSLGLGLSYSALISQTPSNHYTSSGSTSVWNPNEFALLGSVRYHHFFTEFLQPFLDLRYVLGLTKNPAFEESTFVMRNFQLVFGLLYPI